MFGGRRPRIANCHADLLAFHARKIALPPSDYDALRAKRDKVRVIIKRRLREMGYLQPIGFRSQGSVAMRTVTRGGHYGSFDIDDGIYFHRRALTGPLGAEVSPLAARQRILDAAYREHFDDPPVFLKNCVRIFYARGFHIDIPVYRVTTSPFGFQTIELASSSWKPADPAGVTAWFRQANARSPGVFGGRQLARLVRYLKTWICSRSAWQGYMPSGFALTALAVECYRPFPERDDRALLHLLGALFERLQVQTAISHPVIRGEFIVRPDKDATARSLLWALEQGLPRLAPIIEGCPRERALALWDGFFNDDFLRRRPAITFI